MNNAEAERYTEQAMATFRAKRTAFRAIENQLPPFISRGISKVSRDLLYKELGFRYRVAYLVLKGSELLDPLTEGDFISHDSISWRLIEKKRLTYTKLSETLTIARNDIES